MTHTGHAMRIMLAERRRDCWVPTAIPVRGLVIVTGSRQALTSYASRRSSFSVKNCANRHSRASSSGYLSTPRMCAEKAAATASALFVGGHGRPVPPAPLSGASAGALALPREGAAARAPSSVDRDGAIAPGGWLSRSAFFSSDGAGAALPARVEWPAPSARVSSSPGCSGSDCCGLLQARTAASSPAPVPALPSSSTPSVGRGVFCSLPGDSDSELLCQQPSQQNGLVSSAQLDCSRTTENFCRRSSSSSWVEKPALKGGVPDRERILETTFFHGERSTKIEKSRVASVLETRFLVS